MSGGLTGLVRDWGEQVIQVLGYPGIGLLTLFGNANIPIPATAILPVGGFYAQQGHMNFHVVALVGTLGSVIGSVISYGFGALLGVEFVRKYGKYVLMRTDEIAVAEQWFEKHGLQLTLWGRFIPVVRSFVSLPAGMVRANFLLFLFYAVIASLPWCYFWTWLGFKLGENWTVVERYTKVADVVIVLGCIAVLAKFILSRRKKRPVEDATVSEPAVAETEPQ
jgi:membrane protein DedA with SNARE-associated domain